MLGRKLHIMQYLRSLNKKKMSKFKIGDKVAFRKSEGELFKFGFVHSMNVDNTNELETVYGISIGEDQSEGPIENVSERFVVSADSIGRVEDSKKEEEIHFVEQISNDERRVLILEIIQDEKDFAEKMHAKFTKLGLKEFGIFGGIVQNGVGVGFNQVLDTEKLKFFNELSQERKTEND